MASIIQAVVECITGGGLKEDSNVSEKQHLTHNDPRTAEDVATEIVQTILKADKGGNDLKKKVNGIISEYGWSEKIAEWTLAKLEEALKEATKLGPALREAYDKACAIAKGIEGFVQEHPIFCTVIALGVLVLIAPWAIEALGFGELGPMEGSFAAVWQTRYAAYVPKGSLFSFFQRLGMTWH